MAPTLETKYVFTITARIADVTTAGDIGHGVRRIIPITGGEVRGEINGKVLPFVATDLVRLVILIGFPILATWLPQQMVAH